VHENQQLLWELPPLGSLMGPVGPLEQPPGEGCPSGPALAAEGLCEAALQDAVGLNCLLLGLFLLPLLAGQLAAALQDSTD